MEEYAGSDTQGLISEKRVQRSYASSRGRRAFRDPWVMVPSLIAVISLFMVAYLGFQLRTQLRNAVKLPYSPANHMIRYERRPFELGFGENLTEYEADPSPELDAKWDDLYSMGLMAISREQASQLEEKTQPLPHDPENRYVLGMSVFHDLHCINMLRKHLFPDYYTQARMGKHHQGEVTNHMMHCLDALRQSAMCHVDLAIIPFQG
ncbi:hypothetical protein PG993_000176 [Apiospora rasikravindrae]|uniref:Cyclochlorotine biosynthesis protein O n=1 Tax=Apiospora rasikravindrae TaxID=990691 RepID=A0ABR1UAJ9_9PEZI